MKMNKNLLLNLGLILVLLLAACAEAEDIVDDPAGIPNPASEYCEEQGGRSELRTNEDGSVTGYCVFEDGSECEEWAFYNGECEPGEEKPPVTGLIPEGAVPGNAFVNEASLSIAESFPVQIYITIAGDLPDPCHNLHVDIGEPDADNRINITVSSYKADSDMMCAQVLEPFDETITLPTEDLPDGSYTVLVNDEEIGSFNYPG
jgi:putative hemolysin